MHQSSLIPGVIVKPNLRHIKKIRFRPRPKGYGYQARLARKAKVLRLLNRLDEALQVYAEIRLRFPREVAYHNAYAQVLCDLGRHGEALVVYRKTRHCFPFDVACHHGYAQTLMDLGKTHEALQAYAEIKRMFPENVDCLS